VGGVDFPHPSSGLIRWIDNPEQRPIITVHTIIFFHPTVCAILLTALVDSPVKIRGLLLSNPYWTFKTSKKQTAYILNFTINVN